MPHSFINEPFLFLPWSKQKYFSLIFSRSVSGKSMPYFLSSSFSINILNRNLSVWSISTLNTYSPKCLLLSLVHHYPCHFTAPESHLVSSNSCYTHLCTSPLHRHSITIPVLSLETSPGGKQGPHWLDFQPLLVYMCQ